MATFNPFDLLGEDDTGDLTQLLAVRQQKLEAKKPAEAADAPTKAPGKLPSKPLPPVQAVKEARSSATFSRGGGRGGQGRVRGGRGGGAAPRRDFGNGNIDGFAGSYSGGGGGQDGDSGRPGDRDRRDSYGGYRRGGYGNGEVGGDFGRPRRVFDRRSGTGRDNEFKREGYGLGNWGTYNDDVVAQESTEVLNVEEKIPSPEKQIDQENAPAAENNENKESLTNEPEEKEEDKEMTLEEYEKIREEKRKALLSMKTEERKVDLDKELLSMQQLAIKKANDDVFIKLGSDKDLKKQKDAADRDEKARKSVSINEFLKPAEGERYYSPGGRGRGRGRGDRGSFRVGFGRGGSASGNSEAVIKIEDPGQFPTLGGK